LAAHKALGADLSCLTVSVDDAAAYGRIVRDQDGWLLKIVEAKDATEAEAHILEINTGVYVIEAKPLFSALKALKPNNVQGEYYLTDVVAEFRARGLTAAAVMSPDPDEAVGVNDRLDLARAQAILRSKINASWLLAGVTMADPATTYIEAAVRLSPDVTLGPGVVLTGATKVESGAVVGPYVCLKDVWVGPGVVLAPGQSWTKARIFRENQTPNLLVSFGRRRRVRHLNHKHGKR
jgi:bifunctional UDP-N-acetylglucosamine pyrophosphorylase/glucosamine-1-phosphate N-acetyltransferase